MNYVPTLAFVQEHPTHYAIAFAVLEAYVYHLPSLSEFGVWLFFMEERKAVEKAKEILQGLHTLNKIN